jgi:hypothetical protein
LKFDLLHRNRKALETASGAQLDKMEATRSRAGN